MIQIIEARDKKNKKDVKSAKLLNEVIVHSMMESLKEHELLKQYYEYMDLERK